MKVKEVVKKINHGSAKLPAFLQEGYFGKERKLESTDFANYYYDEKERTVMSISLLTDRVVIHYK